MAHIKQQNIDQEEQYNMNDNNISSLIKQIFEQLVCTMEFYYLE
jgi:hypothetical protein